MWQKRILKFIDNPLVLFGFLKRHLFYRFIADKTAEKSANTHFLNGSETIQEIIKYERSIIRAGDGTFGYLNGASIYFNDWRFTYNRKFAKELKKVLSSSAHKNILYCYPYNFFLKTKSQFEAERIGNEWSIWVTTKALLPCFLNNDITYGDALCFHPRYNPNIDFKALREYFSSKHVIIITSNTKRFEKVSLGKTTSFIESPASDAWRAREDLEASALELVKKNGWDKSGVLFMISTAEAAKVMVFNLNNKGYIAWDTGQFFDLAAREIANLNT